VEYSFTRSTSNRRSEQNGLPPLLAQRILRKTASASSSDMRATDANVSVFAREERRKCWGIRQALDEYVMFSGRLVDQ
jgi:hypothetical protein